MSYLNEKVSYLRGLAEGMEIDSNTKEGKLLLHIVEVLGDFADEMEAMDEDIAEIDEYVEAIDEDLADIEDEIYGEIEDIDDLDDYDDYEEIEIECPSCGNTILVDEDLLCDNEDCELEIECPECEKPIYITDDCDCGCDCKDED